MRKGFPFRHASVCHFQYLLQTVETTTKKYYTPKPEDYNDIYDNVVNATKTDYDYNYKDNKEGGLDNRQGNDLYPDGDYDMGDKEKQGMDKLPPPNGSARGAICSIAIVGVILFHTFWLWHHWGTHIYFCSKSRHLSRKYHNAAGKYPTMHHFVTEMCTRVHHSPTEYLCCSGLIGELPGWDILCNIATDVIPTFQRRNNSLCQIYHQNPSCFIYSYVWLLSDSAFFSKISRKQRMWRIHSFMSCEDPSMAEVRYVEIACVHLYYNVVHCGIWD